LEQAVDSVVEDTGITGISLTPRFVFDFDDQVMLEGFVKTEDGVRVHPAFLPSPETLMAWVRRFKARHSPLSTFKLVIKYDTIATDAEDIAYYKMLQFEYREVTSVLEDYQRPLAQEVVDSRKEELEADAHQFTYQLFSSAIEACYDQLVRDAQEEALGAANMQEA
jgi:hypothetical protein